MGKNRRYRHPSAYRPRPFGSPPGPPHLRLVDNIVDNLDDDFDDDEPSPSRQPGPSMDEIESLLEAVANPGGANRGVTERAAYVLYDLEPSQLAPAAQTVLLRHLPVAWRNGWQPAEVHREVARRTNKTGAKLTLELIANDHAPRDPSSLDPRWTAALGRLGLTSKPDPDWIVRAATRRDAGFALTETVIDVIRIIGQLRPIAVLIPPPGAAATGAPIDLHTTFDSPMLERVRALLAKAESTEFAAEAEAFTAKAHELMARHSIDTAMLAARATNPDQPTTIRMPIDNPYADAKVLLCQIVAEHCGARSVYQKSYAFSSVIGFAGDIAATEILFTSLLVQAQSAMQVASRLASGPASSTRGFRSSFLMAYAHRISERLDAINANVMAQAEVDAGYSLVPVLATRDAAVREAVDAQFGELTMTRLRGGRDAAGWTSGRLAADRANLTRGDLSGPQPA